MTEPTPTEDNPPENVLEELLDAFSSEREAGESERFDFDDPSIDRLLGITPEPRTAGPTSVRSAAGTAGDQHDQTPVAEPAARKTIVIGGDEDLPDAAPIEVERESKVRSRQGKASSKKADATKSENGPQARSTIVIDDLDESESIDASAVRSTMGGEQRIRARRISVRRAEGRKRLRRLAIGLVVLAIPVGTLAFVASPVFDVDEVAVQGATYTNPELIDAIIADLTGDAVLLVDTEAIERRLQEDVWVESARVQTDFPHRVLIDIRERQPVAAFQGGDGRFRIIDHESRVLDVIDGIPIAYMLITGDHPDTARGQFVGQPYAAAADLVISLPAEIRAVTASVGLNAGSGALSLTLDSGTLVQLGDSSDLGAKLARLLSIVRGSLVGVCELDVSTREVGSVPC
ncbi:MAG: FtsQ-type POTRA domain-containing protein [Actinobacteria bacterium]|nr:FtsQ-type POTRA domain-containing protein [Actinomycetota bacterium]